MTQYLISFDKGAMTFQEEELPDVAEAARWSRRPRTPTCRCAPTAHVWSTSADSRSSTCPHARRRWTGLPRLPSPAVVLKRSANSCPTRPSDRRATTTSSCPPLPDGTARPGTPGPPDPHSRPAGSAIEQRPTRGCWPPPRPRGQSDWSASAMRPGRPMSWAKIATCSLLSVMREAVDGYSEMVGETRYRRKAASCSVLLCRHSCTHTGFELYPLRADLHRSDREGRHGSHGSFVWAYVDYRCAGHSSAYRRSDLAAPRRI
jgi:hypothetical protein